MRRPSHLLSALALATILAGCQKKAAQAPPQTTPVIPVSHPVERNITDFADYTGRTDAKESVSVRARVTGYLLKVPFEEGAEVKAGDVLFEIDDRPYQALVEQARSQVVLYQAQLKLAKTVLDRDLALGAAAAVGQQQLDQDRAAVEQAEARIKVAEAALANAELNLSFTKVKAPISGRISRYYYTPGNLVTQDQTLLTTVVSPDPMYATGCPFLAGQRIIVTSSPALSERRVQPARVRMPGLLVSIPQWTTLPAPSFTST